MLVDPPIEKLLPHVENRYTLAITIARRTRQLVEGGQPLVEETDNTSLVTLACKELAADKLVVLEGLLDPFVPMRPEIAADKENAREEDEEGDMMLTSRVPAAEEPLPAPVSKIRVMDPNEVFFMPYEMDDEDEDDERSDEEDLQGEDEGEDDVDVRAFRTLDDEEEFVTDDELDHIDGSIDDMPEDEDDDL